MLPSRARKLLSIRLFDDAAGKRWQKSIQDLQLEMLCVSQFTLYNRLKGNKPDFHLAMSGPAAQDLYNSLLQQLQTQYAADKIKGKNIVCRQDKMQLEKDVFLGLNDNRNHFHGNVPYSDGKFGAMMQVYIQNDGPVTIEIESPPRDAKNGSD